MSMTSYLIYRMNVSSTFSSTEVLFSPSRHYFAQKYALIEHVQSAEHENIGISTFKKIRDEILALRNLKPHG